MAYKGHPTKACNHPKPSNKKSGWPRKGTVERVAQSESGAFKILSFLSRGTLVQAGTIDMTYGPLARLRLKYSY